MSDKKATIKLTSAVGINGELIRRGTIVTLPESAAKDLLRRGKAELATDADDPVDEADYTADEGDDQDDDGEDELEPEPATPAAKPKKK